MTARQAALGVGLAILWLAASCDRREAERSAPRPAAPAASTAPAVFREAAGEVGLAFIHFAGSTGEFYFPETVGAGVALLDYDGDGDLDVYLVQGTLLDATKSPADALVPPPSRHWPGNRLFRNELIPSGTLRFTDVTDEAGAGHVGYGHGVAVGDIDNDGDPDLYVTAFGRNVLYRNDGGRFTDMTPGSGADDPRWSTSAAFLDYDRDGDLDLFVTNYVTFTLESAKPCFHSTTGRRDYCGPQAYPPVPDRLFRNDGGGRFTDVTKAAGITAAFGPGLGVTAADFDGDGWPDLYVANDGAANQLWINRRDGTFENRALLAGAAYNGAGAAEAGMGVTAGDVDGDGDEDIFLSHLVGETNTLYVNDGSGNFYDATDEFHLGYPSRPFTGFGTAFFDYDNNGTLDLFVANGGVTLEVSQLDRSPYPYAQRNLLFRNEGHRRFTDVTAAAGPALGLVEVGRGAAFGDIDNDGDIDIVVSNTNGPARLLLNETGHRQHWLMVKLVGVQSSRDGAGARVAVLRRNRPPLWRRAHTDGSYLSASDIRVHFGLGTDTALEGVLVRWPSGRAEVWRDVRADRLVTLREGTGQPWRESR